MVLDKRFEKCIYIYINVLCGSTDKLTAFMQIQKVNRIPMNSMFPETNLSVYVLTCYTQTNTHSVQLSLINLVHNKLTSVYIFFCNYVCIFLYNFEKHILLY